MEASARPVQLLFIAVVFCTLQSHFPAIHSFVDLPLGHWLLITHYHESSVNLSFLHKNYVQHCPCHSLCIRLCVQHVHWSPQNGCNQ
uniref:Secreted protein n=1 Tax=Rhipicephalus appendiculatus TaxID=34631 RepID=A0A131Y9V0_RHIAP